jgi:hypothetical protein
MVAMHRSMVVVAASAALLGGCGWFDSSTSNSEKARPGAERQVGATSALPGASAGRQYDAAVAPVDETRGAPRIGSVVAGKGGQKAQIEATTKEANEREARAREERLRHEREAALKKGADTTAKPAATPGAVTAGPAPDVTPPAAMPPADAPAPAAPAAPATLPADTKQ